MSDNLSNSLKQMNANIINFFKHTLYGGRFTRMQYFLYSFVGGLIYGFISVVDILPKSPLFVLIESIVVVLFVTSISVKRAHDIGHKGTFIISLWATSVILRLLIVVFIFASLKHGNVFALISLCSILLLILSGIKLIYGLMLLFLDSDRGTNAYGPSSKYPDTTETYTQEQESLQEDSKVDQTGHLPSSNEKSRERSKIVFILLLAGIIIGSLSYYFSSSQCALRELEARGIITSGADVNKVYEDGETLLFKAACNGNTEIAKLLIDAGADVNKADEDGETPLRRAASYGHTEIAKLLIDAGADVNKADKYGTTPLRCAEFFLHSEIAKMLIDAGAK